MKRSRHYRGGYQVAGLADLAHDLRINETKAEALLWRCLRSRQLLGFKFRRQHQFGDYIADFYCHEASLVIECDGAVHDQNEQWHHDQHRDAYMISNGLQVLRFANEQVVDNTEAVLKEISRYLQKNFPLPLGEEKG
jgi:type I restriction enzyme R subunit